MADFPSERTAVVTGAGSERGIGRVVADRLARGGWSVAVVDLDEQVVADVAEKLAQDHGVQAIGVAASIADEEAVRSAVGRIEAELPPVVGLANIAGVSSAVPYLEVTTDEWRRVFDINMLGTHLVTQALAHGMVERGLGRVVSLSSCSAHMGGGTFSKVAYSAAKAGVIGFTRAVAREISPHGVTVNAIAPGPIDTDIMGGTLSAERKAELSESLLVPRVGTPNDIAALVEFLLGPDSGWITGACYDVNGGQCFT